MDSVVSNDVAVANLEALNRATEHYRVYLDLARVAQVNASEAEQTQKYSDWTHPIGLVANSND